MNELKKTKAAGIIESFLMVLVLQAMRIGVQRLLALGIPELKEKMLTMCAMIILFVPLAAYIRLRRASIPVFPKPFSRMYIIVTVIAAALLISTPSNYIIGITAILELIYGSVVTPVFEETIFRGYVWERLNTAYKNEKTVYLLTTLMFSLWHIGYMLPQLFSGNLFAVLTKLAAGLVYGLILGFIRLKFRNLYLPTVAHGIMNLFMI